MSVLIQKRLTAHVRTIVIEPSNFAVWLQIRGCSRTACAATIFATAGLLNSLRIIDGTHLYSRWDRSFASPVGRTQRTESSEAYFIVVSSKRMRKLLSIGTYRTSLPLFLTLSQNSDAVLVWRISLGLRKWEYDFFFVLRPCFWPSDDSRHALMIYGIPTIDVKRKTLFVQRLPLRHDFYLEHSKQYLMDVSRSVAKRSKNRNWTNCEGGQSLSSTIQWQLFECQNLNGQQTSRTMEEWTAGCADLKLPFCRDTNTNGLKRRKRREMKTHCALKQESRVCQVR